MEKEGREAVAADEILIEIETDKVVLEVPAPSAGVLVEIVCADGSTVKADQLIARIDTAATALVAARQAGFDEEFHSGAQSAGIDGQACFGNEA